MTHEESKLQQACVRWFRLQYPKYARLLFAVPNGGGRSKVEAAILKGEGVVAGVADLLLLVPTQKHPYLCIEMKTPKGRQSPAQRDWQREVEAVGAVYKVCRSLEEFMQIVNDYVD